MEADKRRAARARLSAGRRIGAKAVFFRKRSHAPTATLQRLGSRRLIVSHKLSSAVDETGRPGKGFLRHAAEMSDRGAPGERDQVSGGGGGGGGGGWARAAHTRV